MITISYFLEQRLGSSLALGSYRMRLGKVWKHEAYPLHQMGITKEDEAAILRKSNLDWIKKSGCFICHFQPIEFFWALSRINPAVYRKVIAYEQNALRRNPKWFLKGSRPLDDQVRDWHLRNPSTTPEEVLMGNYDRCGAMNRVPFEFQPHIPVMLPAMRS